MKLHTYNIFGIQFCLLKTSTEVVLGTGKTNTEAIRQAFFLLKWNKNN